MVGYFERLIWIKIEWKKRGFNGFWLGFLAGQRGDRGDRERSEGGREAAEQNPPSTPNRLFGVVKLHRKNFSVQFLPKSSVAHSGAGGGVHWS